MRRDGASRTVVTTAPRGGAVVRTWRALRWYVGALLGDGDHARYVDHLARTQPGATPLGVGEYWRERYAHTSRHPGSRCC